MAAFSAGSPKASRRIGEHGQGIELRALTIVPDVVNMVSRPLLLPFRLDFPGIISLSHIR